ncbi:metallophosphoesterase family protein [Bacteroidota bacterium]
MLKIGLLSDTHGFFDPQLFDFFKHVDEIWHAGDIGNYTVIEEIRKRWILKAVFGNIDGHEIRQVYKKDIRFTCEQVDVLITHIGGYPNKYEKRIKDIFKIKPPDLFICGHSHILKIIYDDEFKLLHINPGAAGKFGFQKKRTAIRFQIDGNDIKQLEIIELN